jgi:amino acid transporter
MLLNKSNKKLSLTEVISMAVGTMIGASIFSIFGLGAQIAGKELPEAFLLSGVYALVVAYSYAMLGSRIISNAGPIGFILKGLGDSVLTGALSVLLWMCYVVSIALLAKGFAGYFLPLAGLDLSYFNTALVQSVLILFFVVLNFFGSKAVGKAELFIVITKLGILFVFIAGGLWTIKGRNILPNFDYEHSRGLVSASVIFFLSYMGFGLITNASENLRNPQKNVPKAIWLSILIVMVIYMAIAAVTLGNLPLQEVVAAKENALAMAARPFLGSFGFILISIGALLSTSSAMNASIFGGANIAYSLAKYGQLPRFFERKVWFKSTEGLYITAGTGLLFALLFDMGAIAAITSSVVTIIYIFVLISHIRLRKEYGGNLILLCVNLVILCAVFLALLGYQWQSHRTAFYGTILTFSGVLFIEYMLRFVKKRTLTEHHKDSFKSH